jgi:hypothetical protein
MPLVISALPTLDIIVLGSKTSKLDFRIWN